MIFFSSSSAVDGSFSVGSYLPDGCGLKLDHSAEWPGEMTFKRAVSVLGSQIVCPWEWETTGRQPFWGVEMRWDSSSYCDYWDRRVGRMCNLIQNLGITVINTSKSCQPTTKQEKLEIIEEISWPIFWKICLLKKWSNFNLFFLLL